MSTQTDTVDSSSSNQDEEFLFFRRKHARGGDLISGLNLTAMMDVMTILLVYLIKVYAEAPENISLNDDLRPPSSTAPENIVPSVSVTISKSGVMVEKKKILDVQDGQVVAADPKNAYAPLSQALTARVDVIVAIANQGGSPFDGNLMIIADEDTPYELISNVLYHAGKAQFTSYRLVVRKG